MYTKYRLGRETKRILVGHVRNYKKHREWLMRERDRIVNITAAQIDGLPHGTDTKSPTEIATEQLERLECTYPARIVNAIDYAKLTFALDLEDGVREKLLKCIWESCEGGKNCSYEMLTDVPYSRSQFYKRENEFLNIIGQELGEI